MEPALPMQEIPPTPSRAVSGSAWLTVLAPEFVVLHALDAAARHPG